MFAAGIYLWTLDQRFSLCSVFAGYEFATTICDVKDSVGDLWQKGASLSLTKHQTISGDMPTGQPWRAL